MTAPGSPQLICATATPTPGQHARSMPAVTAQARCNLRVSRDFFLPQRCQRSESSQTGRRSSPATTF